MTNTVPQASSFEYDTALAAELVSLASMVNETIDSAFLPDNWQLNYKGIAHSGAGAPQYMFASKFLTINNVSHKVCALVVGAIWNKFLPYYIPGSNHFLNSLDRVIVGQNTTNNASVDMGFSRMYSSIRSKIHEDLQNVKDNVPGYEDSMPLLVIGLGPGAPLAQMAAIDIRPEKQPYNGEKESPVTDIANYTFSAPAFGDTGFASLLPRTVPECFRITAPGDLFPDSPDATQGYAQAGIEKALKLAIPGYDSAWYERDAHYYAALLTGKSIDNTAPDVGTVNNPPNGFDAALAFTLGKLVAVTYQQYQHLGTAPSFNFKPYTLNKTLGADKASWVGLFESPDYLVVAARGSVTWEDTLTNISNSATGVIPWISDDDINYGLYSQPLITLYDTIRDELRSSLNQMEDRPVLLCGHSDGGALANLIALDLQINPLQDSRSVSKIYTFGATPAGTLSFVSEFTNQFGDKNYQVNRSTDVMPKIDFWFGLFKVGTLVNLTGGNFNSSNGSTFHALSAYLNLLDPSS